MIGHDDILEKLGHVSDRLSKLEGKVTGLIIGIGIIGTLLAFKGCG